MTSDRRDRSGQRSWTRFARLAAGALALAAAPALAQSTFVRDTFTGSNGTLLSAHNPDVGNAGSWTRLEGAGANNLWLATNRLTASNSGVDVIYANATPGGQGADQVVAVDALYVVTHPANVVTLVARVSDADGDGRFDYYLARVGGDGAVSISYVFDGGRETDIGTCATTAIVASTTYRLRFEVIDTSLRLYKDDVEICAQTDATITAVGRPGVGINAHAQNEVFADNFLASNAAFGYRRAITFLNSMTPDATCLASESSFPALVTITDPTLATVAIGGRVENANGYDIIFRAADGVTTLDHEIEKYDAATGELVAWVRIPTLAYNADTVIYIYYGNAAVRIPTANPTAVWDASYRAVWHLHDDYEDSTSYNRDGTNNGTANYTPGRIADGDDFDGIDDSITTPSTDLQAATNFTISLWFNADDTDFARHLVWQGNASGNGFGSCPDFTRTEEMHVSFGRIAGSTPDSDTLLFFLGDSDDACGNSIEAFYGFDDTTSWHQVAAVITGMGTAPAAQLYVDGVLRATDTGDVARTGRTTWDTPFRMGRPGPAQRFFDGGLDEVRIAVTPRSSCWIAAEYLNASDFSTHVTIGPEQGPAPTRIRLEGLAAASVTGGGVEVAWQTGFEVDNLGFHVYRERGGERVRVTPSLLAGSALLAGAGTELGAGQSYGWWDGQGGPGDVYWLEEWELSGARRWHGPVAAGAGGAAPKVRRSVRLAGLGASSAGLVRGGPSERTWDVDRGSAAAAAAVGSGAQAAAAAVGGGVARSAPRRRLEPVEPQWAVAGAGVVKLGVRRSGWYRASRDELVAAGLDPSVDPRSLRLYADGEEVAIRVRGEEDGSFGSGDGLEWYGQGLDTPSADTRVYYLVAGGGWGRRIEVAAGGAGGSGGPVSFPYEVVREDNSVFVASLKNGEQDNFFGPVLAGEAVSRALPVHHLDPAGEVALEVRLQGATAGSHRVGIAIGGTAVGRVEWQGREIGVGRFVVPAGLVGVPETTVTFEPLGGEEDVSLIERVTLRYAHTYNADDAVLTFTVPGGVGVVLGQFWKGPVRVVDVTEAGRPVELVGPYQGNGFGLTVPGTGTRTVVASSESWIWRPAWVRANRPSALWAAQGADLVIVAPRDFLPAVEPLAQLRRAEGLEVLVADIEDVVDEFGAGAWGAAALQAFLRHARSEWRHAPGYVLLVGDSTFDPRDYLGYGVKDLVPAAVLETTYFETASDAALADSDGDGVADLAIGRLPAASLAEAQAMVAKLVRYERQGAGGPVVLVADANDDENDFEEATRSVFWAMPRTLSYKVFQRGFLGDEKTRALLYEELQRGPRLVNYLGHGSVQRWAGDVLSVDGVRWLSSNRLPVVLAMTCLNGLFHDPGMDSLGEALLESNGGAAAVWTSTGLTEMAPQLDVNLALVRQLFASDPPPRLGDAIRAALAATADRDVRATWVLLGDPTMRVR